ncbi:MAG: 23S rRNA (pseudouridine(1915)-N(3))-methyltransferase RlmH [Chitinophagales bacterium]|nr:23S rRNA (pseudouridine(1915)-N(3))-methyltransferase RlmH [Chitinophagales bacterium]
MQITYFVTGKTNLAPIQQITAEYYKRLSRYARFEEVVIDNTAIKSTDPQLIKQREGELLLKKILPTDFLILLDEKGKEYTSVGYAEYLQKLFLQSHKRICFVVGGAYGFSDAVYTRANAKLCLSKMTFSHQIIRVVFAEQLYRAFTILHNEPYHHQ